MDQNINTILKFMIKFTEKWILSELKGFDFNYYLMHFLKRCVKKDTIQTIAIFLQQLDIPSLLQINQIIFQLSFDEEEKKKRFTYDHSENKIQLAQLTSAGFRDRFSLVNKIFPDIS